MPKHVISVGFDVPGDVIESAEFDSNSSVLDADVVIFSPNVSTYRTDFSDPQYRGKPLLAEDDSARIQEHSEHWKRELRIALQDGKTIFVMLSSVGDLFIHSGRTEYSGTGRNARATRIVVPFDPYVSVPVPGLVEAVQRRTGERIKTTKDIGVLAPYWQEFGSATCFQIYLERNLGTPALVTQTGDKMVGGIVRFKDLRGCVVFLPPPIFPYMIEDRVERFSKHRDKHGKSEEGAIDREAAAKRATKGTRTAAERSVGKQFLSALIEIDQVLRIKVDKTPTPAWADTQEYTLKEELKFKAEVNEFDEKIAELQRKKAEAEKKLDSAGNLRGLLFETGKPLEAAVFRGIAADRVSR